MKSMPKISVHIAQDEARNVRPGVAANDRYCSLSRFLSDPRESLPDPSNSQAATTLSNDGILHSIGYWGCWIASARDCPVYYKVPYSK